MKAWLKLFRVVNLPTVPGDVFVGAAAVMAGCCRSGECTTALSPNLIPAWWAAAASVFLYAFGLVDNDIVGAKTDKGRPIPDGEISLGVARIARGVCILAAVVVGQLANLPVAWWWCSLALVLSIVVYNRTKLSFLMGFCRGASLACGMAAVMLPTDDLMAHVFPFGIAVFVVWTLYIWVVTWYSKGEENDPEKKRRVGVLVGGIVYLQLTALIVFALLDARTMPLMVAGAVLLVLLRLSKRALPEVSAS